MRFRATATVETPLSVSAKRATGNDLATLPYLPGGTVRGALAEMYLESGGVDQAFQAIFLNEQVRFGDLRKDGACPWPLSMRRCREQDHHPFGDVLVAWGAKERDWALPLKRECGFLLDGGRKCDAKLDLPAGFCQYDASKGRYESVEAGMRRVAHSAVDPDLLRARNGEFHSSGLIHAGQILEGSIAAVGEGATALKNFVGERRTLYAGRGKTRGQGRVTLRLSEEPEVQEDEVAERINALNTTAAARFPVLRQELLFSCTLLSQTILLDEWLFSRGTLGAADIGGAELAGFELIASQTRQVEAAGWYSKARLPKPEVAALSAGSCFLFAKKVEGEAIRDEEQKRLTRALAAAEREGIGERRECGFGEVWCCSPLHYELMEAA